MKPITKIKFEPIFGLGRTDESLIDKKIQELLDAKQVNKEFKDVGKRVTGSKKEKRAYKIIKFLDLAGLEEDPILAQQLVTKDRVYPVLDVQAERDRGVSSGAAYLKVELRNACSKQTQNNAKSRAGFVKTINKLVQDLEKCFTVNEVRKVTESYLNWTVREFLTILFDPEGFEGKTDDETRAYLKDKFYTTSMYNTLVYKAFKLNLGNNFANLIFRRSDSAMVHWSNATRYEAVSKEDGEIYLAKHLVSAQKSIDFAKDRIEKIKKDSGGQLWSYLSSIYSMPPSYKSKSDDELKTECIKLEQRRIDRATESLNNPDKFQMEHPDIWEWFDGEKVAKVKKENHERKINSGIPLDHIERKGGITIPSNFLNEARSTNEDKNPLFSVFGFKSVQFGNAQSDTESREHMRHFLGAVTDLAEILDIDIKQFNQLGSLSMAFATRGTGSANATYTPGLKIINLTNKRGDGTFAHEWGHYLDNILTMLYASNVSNNVGMASHLQNEDSRTKGRIANKSEDMQVQKVMVELMTYIYNGEVKGSKSNYYKNSSKMSSDYWVEPHELFARAWETYVFDKLDKVGRSNNYLTSNNYFKKFRIASGESVCVYPEGIEREALYILFDKLISVIKSQYALRTFKPFSNTRKDEYERFEGYNFELLKFNLLDLELN